VAFRTRRQHRYEVLKDYGLLPFEARELSRLTFAEMRTPYIKDFVRMRTAWAERMPSRAEYVRQIREHYLKQGWDIPTGIWDWIRVYEEAYKKDHPDYETPPGPAGKKKRKKFVQWRKYTR